ncbi:MAG: prepilin-type N-terminal cleavage/methylation domain-containing protein [Candidatus Paceibacterota bacterium]
MNTHRGFTLVEILITIAIIGILSSIILVNVTSARERAMIAKAELEIRSLRNSVLLLSDDTRLWPGGQDIDVVACSGTGNEVMDLSTGSAGILSNDGTFGSTWNGPYAQEVPTDPWGRNYFFDTDYSMGGNSWIVAVGSLGPNGGDLGDYDSDNIVYVVASSTCP